VLARVPRIATAAVRIPDPELAQLPLKFSTVGPQIFIHEGARQALERRLITAHGAAVQLAVTDNRHRMVTRTQSRGILQVRVHMMFLGARYMIDSLVRYVVTAIAGVGRGRLYILSNSHRIAQAASCRPAPRPGRGRSAAILGT
jgi:hypothetical protein